MYKFEKRGGGSASADPIVCEVEYNERLSPKFFGRCATELLAAILYFKGQIPSQLSELKIQRNMLQKQWLPNPCEGIENQVPQNRTTQAQKRVDLTYLNKLDKFLTDIDKLNQELNDIITQTTAVHSLRVVILLGPALITPKDVFIIEIPKSEDLNHVPSRNHFARLLKRFITWDELSQRPSPPLTNVYVLLDLPKMEENTSNWFLPKPMFNHLHKGRQAYIKIKITGEGSDVTNDKPDTEMQDGTECCNAKCEHMQHDDEGASSKELQQIVDPDKDLCEYKDSPEEPGIRSSMENLKIQENQLGQRFLEPQDQANWFQAPVVLKGLHALNTGQNKVVWV